MASEPRMVLFGRLLGLALIVLAVRAGLDPNWPIPVSAVESARHDRAEAARLYELGLPVRPHAEQWGGGVVLFWLPGVDADGRIRGPWQVHLYDSDYVPLSVSTPIVGGMHVLSSADLADYGDDGPVWWMASLVGEPESRTPLARLRPVAHASAAPAPR